MKECNQMKRILIVGGVAGGATAAARLRRLDEDAKIIIFEKGPHPSYANCGLPYHIGGVIPRRSDLLVQSAEDFFQRYRVEVRLNQEVVAINSDSRFIVVKNLGLNEVYEESYDALILAPGATPVLPEVSLRAQEVNLGSQEAIFPLHTITDMDAIISHIYQRQARSAVVLGGGFIGIEAAENLVYLGLDVTVIQRSAQVLPPLDAEIASYVHDKLRDCGVQLILNNSIKFVQRTTNEADEGAALLSITLADDQELAADLIIGAIGVKPLTTLAVDAGLELGVSGGIAVDAHMRTSDPYIYAVGDAVESVELVTQVQRLVALAGPANKQARVAADNVCGIASTYKGPQASTIIKIFDLTVACTGINEKTAKSCGLDYDKVYLLGFNHASYYPGTESITIKVLFERPTGRILGAQIIGRDGVDKRCDILATAIRARMTAADLVDLELCYSPPYSSAKDPINTVGLMIENLQSGRIKQFHWHDVSSLPRDGSATLLDVRTRQECVYGTIDGFKNTPVDELRGRLSELDPSKPVFLYCHSGLRSYVAARMLAQKGFDVSHLSGGYALYAHSQKQ